MRRPVVASSSPRSIRSQSGSTLGRRAHPHRTVPRVLANAARPHLPLLGKEWATPGLSKNHNTESCDPFHPRGHARSLGNRERSCGSWRRRRAVRSFGHTGTDRVGWYACPWRTLFATEWSAARQNPMRAAALHFGAAISADVKARRILPSDRRKFPSGNFRSARDLEGAKRVSRGQAYRENLARLRHRNPSGPCAVCYNEMRNVPITARRACRTTSPDPPASRGACRSRPRVSGGGRFPGPSR